MAKQENLGSLGAALGGASPLRPGFCGDIDMRIARDGTWYYRGTPIGRKRLVRLFASILSRDEAGDYWLTTPVEKARIRVEDAPFLAVALEVRGEGRGRLLCFRTNLDEEVCAGPEHPLRMRPRPGGGEKAPYLLLRDGLEALVSRPVYYELVALGGEEEAGGARRFGVRSGGHFFALD